MRPQTQRNKSKTTHFREWQQELLRTRPPLTFTKAIGVVVPSRSNRMAVTSAGTASTTIAPPDANARIGQTGRGGLGREGERAGGRAEGGASRAPRTVLGRSFGIEISGRSRPGRAATSARRLARPGPARDSPGGRPRPRGCRVGVARAWLARSPSSDWLRAGPDPEAGTGVPRGPRVGGNKGANAGAGTSGR